MKVLFDNRQDIKIFENYEDIVTKAIEKSLDIEQIGNNYEISVSFVDNNEIKKLNREFRNIDRETDVLSFPTELYSMDIKNIDIPLGDIVISVEKAEEQALEFGHSLIREIVYLTVHSMFHLLGYDHIDDDDKLIMREREKKTINILGIYKDE